MTESEARAEGYEELEAFSTALHGLVEDAAGQGVSLKLILMDILKEAIWVADKKALEIARHSGAQIGDTFSIKVPPRPVAPKT